ncbi:MAG: CpXC domain-containing protein [Bacteroidales bacterium]|nr:CpXC domain-containing protein [Bacteroidales bacterium]
MSQIHKDSITCPKCSTKGDFEYWASINIDLNPELKDKIFNEEIFVWTCPKCGTRVFIPFGTLYHDMKHSFMIFFSHDEPENDNKYDPMEIPDMVGIEKNYTFRVVYGLLNFKEKILVMENMLNDIAVEKLKYMIIHHMDESMAEKGVRLFFQGITKSDEENEYGQMVFYCQMPDDKRSGNIALPMERYYEQCLSLELDKRFSVTNCMCIDEGWIADKMKGTE